MSLILASSSPFRKAILENLGIAFETASPDINESRENGESPFNLALRLSQAKALEVAKSHSGLIIASDQVATLGNGNNAQDEIFTKPGSHENTFLQLKRSSGKTITFLTALTLLNTETSKIQTHVELFKVTFKQLSDNQILSYLNKEDVLNCAGSIKSEGLGAALINRMESNDPYSLIGLATIQLAKMLAKENFHIL